VLPSYFLHFGSVLKQLDTGSDELSGEISSLATDRIFQIKLAQRYAARFRRL
jgi:hypothetical protein